MWQIFVLKNDSVVNPRKLYCKLPWILLGENDTFQVFLKCSTLKLKNLVTHSVVDNAWIQKVKQKLARL